MNSGSAERASDYLRDVLGNNLETILAETAKTRPEDPIAFIADKLERIATARKSRAESRNNNATRNQQRADSFDSRNSSRRNSLEDQRTHRRYSKDNREERRDSREDRRDDRKSSRESRRSSREERRKERRNSSVDDKEEMKEKRKELDRRIKEEEKRSRLPVRKGTSSTLASEPAGVSSAPSTTSWSYNSYEGKSSGDSRRSLSLNALRDSEQETGLEPSGRKSRRKKKKVPTVAMTADDYKKKRGIIRKTEEDNLVERKTGERRVRRKIKEPTILTEDFDLKKHFEKSRKMRENRNTKER